MTEPTVPVPVLVAEAAARHLDREGYHGTATLLRDALLSQPNPTAEPCSECQYVEGHRDDCGRLDDYLAHRDDAAPPSIADMVPGTRLVGRTRDGVLALEDRVWMVCDHALVASVTGNVLQVSRIDPSTIRDVQAPKEPS